MTLTARVCDVGIALGEPARHLPLSPVMVHAEEVSVGEGGHGDSERKILFFFAPLPPRISPHGTNNLTDSSFPPPLSGVYFYLPPPLPPTRVHCKLSRQNRGGVEGPLLSLSAFPPPFPSPLSQLSQGVTPRIGGNGGGKGAFCALLDTTARKLKMHQGVAEREGAEGKKQRREGRRPPPRNRK